MKKTQVASILVIGLLVCGMLSNLALKDSCYPVSGVDAVSEFWLGLAKNAWIYFQPEVGLDPSTGLPAASLGSPYFTDWDLGLYIQAIIDAQKIGLIETSGKWGVDDRVDKVLTFLETRPLNPKGVPYLFYASNTGGYMNQSQQGATDAGKLFVALKNLADFKPDLKNRIDNIVYNRTNYEINKKEVDVLLPKLLNGTHEPQIYDYYVACGFAYFWPQRFTAEADAILNQVVSAPALNYSGIMLPKARLSCDPMLHYLLEFDSPDARMVNLTRQVYLAQERYYNSTGVFRAFGEIDSGLPEAGFFYEWVVRPDGRMWILQTVNYLDTVHVELAVTPVICFKVAVGFLALYNSPYAYNMVNYLLNTMPRPNNGYNGGLFEDGALVTASLGVGNGLIVTEARYAIQNSVNVTMPVPAPTLTPTPTSHSQLKSPSIKSATGSNDAANTNNNTPQPSPNKNQSTIDIAPDHAATTAPNNMSYNPAHQPEAGQPTIYGLTIVAVSLSAVIAIFLWRKDHSVKSQKT